MRENGLRWFTHIYRRPVDAILKRVDRIVLDGNSRGRGIPKLALNTVVRKD